MDKQVMLKAELPLFSTYHYQMIPGVALAENPTGQNWYLNQCCTLQCHKRLFTGLNTPEVNVCRTELPHINVVDVIPYDLRFCKENLHHIVKTVLNAGYYVAFENFDDYYIQGKSWYQQRHFLHDGLICGYDDVKETYSIMAYDVKWICRLFETPQKCLVQGMQFLPEQEVYSRLLAIKAKDFKIELDLTRIKHGMIEHLDLNFARFPPEEDSSVFGTAVHQYIGMYLDDLLTGKVPYMKKDRRLFRLLWEYRRCMYLRLGAVGDVLKNDIARLYKPIAEESNLMRIKYAKYSMKRDDSLLQSLKKQLVDVQKREEAVLEQVILILEKEGF